MQEMHHKLIWVVLLTLYLIAFPSIGKEKELYQSAINNQDRLASDLQYDSKRKPAEILPFTQIGKGNRVLELGAGGGYTTELLARTVGDTGKVFAHFLYDKERLKDNRLPNVVPMREHSLHDLAEVLTELKIEDSQLDAVVVFFVLHDIYLNNEMSDALLTTLHGALKPGGKFIILDNAARADSGLTHIGDLHRIGEDFVISVMTEAGFKFDAQSNVLRNEADDRTKPWGDFKGLQDRFAFRFVKPED
ncbi:MAG: methyltransferase domain-containing protein [Aestuariibacter sp.]